LGGKIKQISGIILHFETERNENSRHLVDAGRHWYLVDAGKWMLATAGTWSMQAATARSGKWSDEGLALFLGRGRGSRPRRFAAAGD